jgi:hypothetical protein
METKKLETRNQKTLKELVITNNAIINAFKNKEGKSFFICGAQTGYISAKAAEIIDKQGFSDPDALQFAEVLNENTGEWIPQIMPVGNKPTASWGIDLIRNH